MKVLFVSEIEQEYQQLARIFKNIDKKLELITAPGLNKAIETVTSDGPFGFFIIDVEIKNSEPNKLAQALIDLTGDRPIFFLGSAAIFTDRIEQDTFSANSHNVNLLKPIDRKDFLEELTKSTHEALNWAQEEEFESSLETVDPKDFVQMKLKGFYLFNEFPYDIYLEITATQYIKIISANKPYTISTLAAYAKKNIKFLYIKKDDQLKYLEQEAKKCLKALRKVSPQGQDILIISLRSITIMHQYMLALGVTPAVLTLANAITDAIIKITERYSNLKKILKGYPYLYQGVASKSLLTGLISCYLCKKMGWDSVTTKKKLTISSILQDYSLEEEDLSKINHVNDPRIINYSDQVIKKFVNHPHSSAEVARQFTMYPDIDFLIENHHELPNRKGFPNKLPTSKLTSLNAVFNISQFIAAEIDGVQYHPHNLIKAFSILNKDYSIGNFKDPLKHLKNELN